MSRRDALQPPPVDAMPQPPSARRQAITGTFGADEMSGPIRMVRPDQVAVNPENPREDNSEELEELTASISELGQIQAATTMTRGAYVAAMPEHEEELGSAEYVVISGSRRLLAVRAAGLERFLLHVNDTLTTRDQILEFALVENVQRQDIKPLSEARALQKLVEVHGSGKAVAARLGKSPGWVSQRVALLELTPQLQQKLHSGELPLREARDLARKPADEQVNQWERRQQDDGADDAGSSSPSTTSGSASASSTGSKGDRSPRQNDGAKGAVQLTLELTWAEETPESVARQLYHELSAGMSPEDLQRVAYAFLEYF